MSPVLNTIVFILCSVGIGYLVLSIVNVLKKRSKDEDKDK